MNEYGYGVGFDRDDADHMNTSGYFVELAYTVRNAEGRVMFQTDLVADGPELAALILKGIQS